MQLVPNASYYLEKMVALTQLLDVREPASQPPASILPASSLLVSGQ